MRIVIDLQGAQGASRHRGIGRYSLSLAQSMARNRGNHEIIIALNGMFPDSIEPIRAAFHGILEQCNIRVWQAANPVYPLEPANDWRRRSAEFLREAFLLSLEPDVIHITSLFEGFTDDAVHTIGLLASKKPTAVTLYDLIPLMQSDVYLKPNPLYEVFYKEKLQYLKKADLYLAISDSSRKEAVLHLPATEDETVNIGAAADEYFQPINLSHLEKQRIRARFGLSRPFLMYSGATDDRKNHLRLIKSFSMLPRALRQQYQLAIVGHLPSDHRENFEKYIKLCGLKPTDILITGRVTEKEMLHLYNICELFVFPSWHEGFGLPALEAMSCGAPVIGSNTSSLPEVIGRADALFNPFDEKSISEKIVEVLTNNSLRESLVAHGLAQSKKFNWNISAKKAISALEALHKSKSIRSTKIEEDNYGGSITSWLIKKIAETNNTSTNENDWLKTASSMAENHSISATKNIFIDISELSQRDHKTGIQRVVRSILNELIADPPNGFKVEPVYAIQHNLGYRYARKFSSTFTKTHNEDDQDEVISINSGDIFLGLDLQHHIVLQQVPFYAHLRNIGVEVYFVVYDLLPVLLPKMFPDGTAEIHARWLEVLANTDGVVCISRSVANEMVEWLNIYGPKRLRPLKVDWFHLGADVAGSVPTRGLPADSKDILKVLSKRPTFLSVGTIEPRKGQMQTLLAFEEIWEQGIDVNLVLVGKNGWNVDLLVQMLRNHSERNKRLFWLEGITDEYLEKVYSASTCLIAASEGEGFGLPLIEAAQHRIPIIARDIPVFREVAGSFALYFSGLDARSLADAVKKWLILDAANDAPQSEKMPWITWRQCAKNLLQALLNNRNSQYWMPDNSHRFLGNDKRLGTQVGSRSGQNIKSSGEPGYLMFGPYIPLDSGRYKIVIRGTSHSEIPSEARMDVAVEKGNLIVGDLPLNIPDKNGILATLFVSLSTPCNDLEVRVWTDKNANITITMMQIVPWDDSKESSDAFAHAEQGNISPDQSNSSIKVVKHSPNTQSLLLPSAAIETSPEAMQVEKISSPVIFSDISAGNNGGLRNLKIPELKLATSNLSVDFQPFLNNSSNSDELATYARPTKLNPSFSKRNKAKAGRKNS